jgi:hypothetical protein
MVNILSQPQVTEHNKISHSTRHWLTFLNYIMVILMIVLLTNIIRVIKKRMR